MLGTRKKKLDRQVGLKKKAGKPFVEENALGEIGKKPKKEGGRERGANAFSSKSFSDVKGKLIQSPKPDDREF